MKTMAWGLGKTRYSPIGIDFGVDRLKLIQILPGNPPQLVAMASAPIPPEFRQNPAARRGAVAALLKDLVKRGGFKGKKALCSISSLYTLVQHVPIGKAETDEDIREQIDLHLRQRLNVEPSRMVVRHIPIMPQAQEGASRREVICIAVNRDAVMNHLEMAHQARLEIVGMHAEVNALVKAFEHLYRTAEDQQNTTMFIDIGAATTKAVVTQGSRVVFARMIHSAGDHLTRALAQRLGVEFAEARRRRIEGEEQTRVEPAVTRVPTVKPMLRAPQRTAGGFALLDSQIPDLDDLEELGGSVATKAMDEPVPTANEPPAETPIDGCYSEPMECLIDELQLSVRYYQGIFPGRPIQKLVFLGGESHHTELCQHIARSLRIGAQLGDPLARLTKDVLKIKSDDVDLRKPQPGWAVALGLSLSEPNL
ncbi:MAG: pilus assembly protein PilM [Phycisphaeraceae bacterium]|nr:pilus assembly protein PilM [Phycisphaeraceae bacterium]